LFDAFDAVLGDDASDEKLFESAARGASVGETPAERELCSHAGSVLRAFRSLDGAQREAIRPKVLEMSRGMREYSTRAHAEGRLRIRDVVSDMTRTLDATGCFVFIGFRPNTGIIDGHFDHDADRRDFRRLV